MSSLTKAQSTTTTCPPRYDPALTLNSTRFLTLSPRPPTEPGKALGALRHVDGGPGRGSAGRECALLAERSGRAFRENTGTATPLPPNSQTQPSPPHPCHQEQDQNPPLPPPSIVIRKPPRQPNPPLLPSHSSATTRTTTSRAGTHAATTGAPQTRAQRWHAPCASGCPSSRLAQVKTGSDGEEAFEAIVR